MILVVYMILNGEVCCYIVTGCICSFFSRSIQYNWLFINEIFLLLFQELFCFVVSVYYSCHSRGEKEDYIL